MTKKDELYEKIIAEKERTIEILIADVDYLRRELDMRPHTFPTTNVRSDYSPADLTFDLSGGMQAWMSEEEQDIQEMVANGRLTKEEADAALIEIHGNIDVT
jgi:hypothetical protein